MARRSSGPSALSAIPSRKALATNKDRICMVFSEGSLALLLGTHTLLLTRTRLLFGMRKRCMTTCLILRSTSPGPRWFSLDLRSRRSELTSSLISRRRHLPNSYASIQAFIFCGTWIMVLVTGR